MAIPPRPGIVAYVRDMVHEHQGRDVRGTLHFAPGTLVYVNQPFSGDGWERTYISGLHRDDGRFASLLGPRTRLVHHHRRLVTDQEVLSELDRTGGYWPSGGPFRGLLEAHSEDPLDDTRRTGWPDGQWEALTRTLLCPQRPRAEACVARVLDVSLEEARAALEACAAGRALRAVGKGRPVAAPLGANPLRKARESWEALAPDAWLGDPTRAFVSLDGRVSDAPDSPLGVASFCSDPGGIATAEALARELAARARLGPDPLIAWRPVSRGEALQRAPRLRGTVPPSAAPPPVAPARTPRGTPVASSSLADCSFSLASVLRALADAEPGWRPLALGRIDSHPEFTEDLFGPLFALLSLGYALESLTPGRVTLFCPVLPGA